jgi:hypothetical protein
MIDPARAMAGKVGELPDRPGGDGSLAWALAANKDRHAAEIDENLRSAAGHRVGGDRGPEHLDIPIRRGFRILADDVNMVELEGGITHRFPSSTKSPEPTGLSGHVHQLQRV